MAGVRAVAVGIPDRLKDQVARIPGVVVEESLVGAANTLVAHPGAAVMYGENTFGDAVTGQPVFLLAEQRMQLALDYAPVPRVIVVIDCAPSELYELAWDDPRRLVSQAGVRLRAGRLVDLSHVGAALSLDVVLDELGVDSPPE